MFSGKRELLARSLYWSGAAFLLGKLPEQDSLLVLNYHRIGDSSDDLFDPGVFSATADELSDQLSYLKRHVSLVTLEEALAFIEGTTRKESARCRVLITFDDGYLDNFGLAFPILRSHGVQGVFFLATDLIGSGHVPWWDEIAYIMRTGKRRQFTLTYPSTLVVDVDKAGLIPSILSVLYLYKDPRNTDRDRFISALKEKTIGEDPPLNLRRFLNWDEAREMVNGGMAIGSHTHTHCVLSELSVESQCHELTSSRMLLKKHLGIEADTIAFPFGGRNRFSDETQELARQAGYRAAFSFYGGINRLNRTQPFDVKRIGVGGQSRPRFRVQATMCKTTGRYWP